MLKNKVIVVTGGAGLLGQSFCNAIAKNNGIPIVADIDQSAASSVATRLRTEGFRADSVELDIGDQESIDKLITDLRSQYDRIDAVVNNAYPRNINFGRFLEDVEYVDFCENISLHLGGYFLVAQRFAIAFRNHGGGNIVNLSSIYGMSAPRFEIYAGTKMTMPVEYAAIKAGVNHLTRYFAQYYKRDGIRCNALAPGGVRNKQHESFMKNYDSMCGNRGMLETVDLEGALLFLLGDASRYMTGQVLVVDDGWSL
jgi:NAD(P)-dependent dehydrogenase (short-subunit alcohol dehydrogenase family)